MVKAAAVDNYIGRFPPHVQQLLQQVRSAITELAPDAEETIKYGIPTFVQNGNLVHFAAFKHHIGFYPTSSGIEVFKMQLSGYKYAKGSVQFPLKQPLPLAIIKEIVTFRLLENEKRV